MGMFDSPEKAAEARDVAAIDAFGEFAQLNYPINKYVKRRDNA
jgi:hypothetical protein